MRIYHLDGSPVHTISEFDSRGAAISGIARGEGTFQLGYLQLHPGGVVGAHPATSRQLLIVISGEAWVSGGDGVKRRIHQGMASSWEADEVHETSTETGLTAVVLESPIFDLPSPAADASPVAE